MIKENNFLLCSVVDDLISQLITEEGQDKHEHMRWFDSSSPAPHTNTHTNIKEVTLKFGTMQKEEKDETNRKN